MSTGTSATKDSMINDESEPHRAQKSPTSQTQRTDF